MDVFFRRKPLIAYFVLAYTLFWGVFLVAFASILALGLTPNELPSFILKSLVILSSSTPGMAAFLVTCKIDGWTGVKRLFAKYLQFRIGLAWYFAAMIPLVLAFVTTVLYLLLGGSASGRLGGTIGYWVSLIVYLMLAGPISEEAGWRGFALPRLLAKHGPVKASLILGLLWGFWHAPLWVAMSGYVGIDLVIYIIAFMIANLSLTYLMTWISVRTGFSLVPIVLIHFFFNAGSTLVGMTSLGLVPDFPYVITMACLTLPITVVVHWISIDGKGRVRRSQKIVSGDA